MCQITKSPSGSITIFAGVGVNFCVNDANVKLLSLFFILFVLNKFSTLYLVERRPGAHCVC